MSQAICVHCSLPLKPNERFCGQCGTPVVGWVDPSTAATAPDLAMPDLGSPTLSAVAAKSFPLGFTKRTLIYAGAGLVALVVLISLGIVIGSSLRSDQDQASGVVSDGDADQGGEDEVGVAPVTTEAPPTAAAPQPVIAPHYSPVAGSFAAADPARFAVSGFSGVTFLSPSGNLGCAIAVGTAGHWGCAIVEHHWVFENDSSDDYCYQAEGSCGEGIEATGDGPTHPRRADEWTFPAAIALFNGGSDGNSQIAVLQYGESLTLGTVICYSESIGVSCQSTRSGHGFTIARDRNDIY